jgi:hypothetical protein
MSDGHGPTSETPSGWSAEQPPPYSAPPASPWTAPGSPQQAPYGEPYGPPQQQQQPYEPGPKTPYPPQPQPGYGFTPPPPVLRPGIIPLRPLGLGDILDGTIKLIRSNPKAVLGLSAIAALLASIPVAVGQAFLLRSMGDVLANPSSASAEELTGVSSIAALYGSTLVSYAIQFIVVTLLTGMLTRILGRAVFGGNLSPGEAWRLVKGRIPALFGVMGLTAVILLVPVLVVGLLVVAVALNAPAGAQTWLPAVILLLPFPYFVYYLFVRARFGCASPAVVLEGKGPLEAMRRAWNLVTGDFWRVFGIVLLMTLLALFVPAILSVPFTIAGTLFGLLGAGSVATSIVSAVFIAIGATLAAMITYPFEAGLFGLLYADRRMRSEAFDLVLQTAAIEQQRQGWVHASADELWHPSNSARS